VKGRKRSGHFAGCPGSRRGVGARLYLKLDRNASEGKSASGPSKKKPSEQSIMVTPYGWSGGGSTKVRKNQIRGGGRGVSRGDQRRLKEIKTILVQKNGGQGGVKESAQGGGGSVA